MVKTHQGSAATALLILCSAGALVAGIHAGPQQRAQDPLPVVDHHNPTDQRLEMIRALRSIEGTLQKESASADRQQLVDLLKSVNTKLGTMDQRLKQIEVELARANQGG
ncbi:MAG: hypothetical protein ISR76_11265 [Planctomycetes bacterium]|nr:hypothetical protein [Planctomycetota bacterium]MBL7009569.1 hypothetical protein [Planctomycetota bacterium]